MSLEIKSLCIFRGRTQSLFDPLSCVIPPRVVLTVMGPSGVGKSSLLHALAGHLPPGLAMSGSASLNGRELFELSAERRRLGLLFQDALLFPHLSVGDNLAFGLAGRVVSREARRTMVESALDSAGLSGFHDRDPGTLSGGQRSRAALMRTLLAEPEALLLDEPFSKLDSTLKDEIRSFTFSHARARSIPVLLVTHDEGDAAAAGGPVLALRQSNSTV